MQSAVGCFCIRLFYHNLSYTRELHEELEEEERYFIELQRSKQEEYKRGHLNLQRDRDLDGSMHIVRQRLPLQTHSRPCSPSSSASPMI